MALMALATFGLFFLNLLLPFLEMAVKEVAVADP